MLILQDLAGRTSSLARLSGKIPARNKFSAVYGISCAFETDSKKHSGVIFPWKTRWCVANLFFFRLIEEVKGLVGLVWCEKIARQIVPAGYWDLNDQQNLFLSEIAGFTQILTYVSSTLVAQSCTFPVLAVERYLVVCRPMEYKLIWTNYRRFSAYTLSFALFLVIEVALSVKMVKMARFLYEIQDEVQKHYF